MSSIRKWLASKVFSSVLSNDGHHHLNDSNGSHTNSDNGGFSSLFGSPFSNPSTSSSGGGAINRNGDGFAIPGSSQDHTATIFSTLDSSSSSVENQSYFSVIYHHYNSRIRKHQIQTATIQPNDKFLITLMYQFYQANEELNYTSSELDTFDGRKDTDRCSALVNSLKKTQDRVISLIFSIMDEIGCERASREYRLKFPDELLTGEGIESLNSQIWFGAECLTAGSTITNNQDKSNYLRPIAINLTTTLDQIRYELRSCCNYLPKTPRISKDLIRKLENFDNLFSSFEYDYVKAMLQIKNCEDIENLQELTILFSETLSYSLEKGLISKDEVDGCQPSVMIALPRLSIVRGLLQGFGSVVCKHDPAELTTILRPYHNLLLEFHEFLMNLSDDEVFFLERLLSTNHDNLIDYSVDNHSANISSLMMIDSGQTDQNSHQQHQDSLLAIFNKFFRHAKRMKDSCPRNPELTANHLHHSHNYHDEEDDNQLQSMKKHQSTTTSTIFRKSLLTNRYISASVDFLLTNNVRNDSANNGNDESGNNNIVHPQRYSPYKSNEALFRFNSLPNINFNLTNDMDDDNSDIRNPVHKRSSSISRDYSSSATTTSTSSSCPSVSITCSSSSISVELDFLKQIKDMLKRTQLKTLTKNRNCCPQQQQQTQHRSTSSGGVATNSNVQPLNEILANPRAKTAADRRRCHHHHLHHNDIASNIHCGDQHSAQKTSTAAMFTPTTSTFSNNSVHFDLDSFYTDDLSQLTLYTRKILHQVFVMISRIADEFQTNYASELRNILRTVFMLQDIQEEEEEKRKLQIQNNQSKMMMQPIEVQIGQLYVDNSDNNCNDHNTNGFHPMDNREIEEAIDACHEYLVMNQTNMNDLTMNERIQSTSNHSSHKKQRSRSPASSKARAFVDRIISESTTDDDDDDNTSCDRTTNTRYNRDLCHYSDRTYSSLDDIRPKFQNHQGSTSSLSTNQHNIRIKSAIRTNGVTDHEHHQNSQTNISLNSSHSTSTSISSSNQSSHSLQPSHFTSSSATTIDETRINNGELPPFLQFTNTDSQHGMIPILGSAISMLEQSSAMMNTTATRLLIPPVWKPDDSVTSCESCSQPFTFMRRRHHCRRCGRIFCHQCSSNFVALKCFGYAKPVRVCDECFIHHQQQQQSNHDQQPSHRHHHHHHRHRHTNRHRHNATFGASS